MNRYTSRIASCEPKMREIAMNKNGRELTEALFGEIYITYKIVNSHYTLYIHIIIYEQSGRIITSIGLVTVILDRMSSDNSDDKPSSQ